MLPRMFALALACATAPALAQFVDLNPGWKEADVPPPPAVVRTKGLIAIELPGSLLRFGVDPASVSVGSDGIVRYVVVATSSTGTVNAIYEGIRCASGEMKVYARHNPDSGWVPSKTDWEPLHGRPNLRHTLVIARTGACIGEGAAGNATQVVRALRAPVDHRFGGSHVN